MSRSRRGRSKGGRVEDGSPSGDVGTAAVPVRNRAIPGSSDLARTASAGGRSASCAPPPAGTRREIPPEEAVPPLRLVGRRQHWRAPCVATPSAHLASGIVWLQWPHDDHRRSARAEEPSRGSAFVHGGPRASVVGPRPRPRAAPSRRRPGGTGFRDNRARTRGPSVIHRLDASALVKRYIQVPSSERIASLGA